MDDEEINIPDLQDYISIKDAAKMLGLGYTTLYRYVTEGRIKAVRVSNVIVIPIEELRNFKPGISGRPRNSIPLWRISPEDNTLLQTSIFLQIREGKRDEFLRRIEAIRQKKVHLFPGTIARYIAGSASSENHITITLIWRSSVMPDDATRQQALAAFQQELADVVDWSTARYDDGTVLMHT